MVTQCVSCELMDHLAEELHRALLVRADALAEKIDDYRGRLGDTRLPIAGVLDMFRVFPDSLKYVIEIECERNPDPRSRVETLRPLLIHLTEVTGFVDTWLSRETQFEVPLYLLGAIKRSCEAMSIEEYEPIVVPGSSDNYHTLAGDIRSLLFDKLGDHCPPPPPELKQCMYVLIRVPQLEGSNVLWAPIILGHELAHLAANVNLALSNLNLQTQFDDARAREVSVPGVEQQGTSEAVIALYGIAQSWAVELLCDAYAVRSFGIGGVAAMSEYLEVIGAIDRIGITHPPGRLRISLMLSWLSEHDPEFDRILMPWREVGMSQPDVPYPDWAAYLFELFLNASTMIRDEADRWRGSSYDMRERSDIVRAIASDLADGIPSDLTYLHDDQEYGVKEADVVAAAWLCRIHGFETPFAELARKGLEIQEFVRHWEDADGEWTNASEAPSIGPIGSEDAVLSARQIQKRIQATDTRRLVIRPYMYGSADGVSVDIRLGNQFIVFVRTKTPSFDPLITGHYPRSMQRFLQLPWDEKFVLHPHELVLAATLEYFVIPSDLTAQVVTRSSYGRLGLISATAVQVHPNFHGSLTLELVNLGTVPLELKPGARIAQLVFSKTAESAMPDAKYHCTVGPQFSRVHADNETEILRRLAHSG